jgi:ATP-dependent helicase/nuclease subunit B
MAGVFTIPAYRPFLDDLALGLMSEGAERLADHLVLLPSRRACIALRDTFLRLGGGRPMLLPRLAPVGDLDADELSLDAAIEIATPPALPGVRRQLLLTKLLAARLAAETQGEALYNQAVRLAGELAAFLDEMQTEEVGLGGLEQLVPDELAEHWRRTLAFLAILREAWPAVLAEEGRTDAAEHRGALLRNVARSWQQTPPARPVVVAGVVGSVPAVAQLLAVIARLPEGRLVLPALDVTLDEEAWRDLSPSHPQWTLRRLLRLLDVERVEVGAWPVGSAPGSPPERVALLSQALRPAGGTSPATAATVPPAAMEGLEIIEAPDHATEALTIALRLRHALETPERRAALISPDRNLARRVAAELTRWGIQADDSAGRPLDQTAPGSFLLLAAHLLVDDASPSTLLAVLKHPLAAGGMGQRDFRRLARALERLLLRGPRPAGGVAGLTRLLSERSRETEGLRAFLERLLGIMEPARRVFDSGEPPMGALLAAHLAFAEALAADENGTTDELWAREAGEAARRFLLALGEAAGDFGPLPAAAYPAVLAVLMARESVRPRAPGHPRIAILGQLESRLVQADLVVLGGLNEGAWPAQVDSGPWLNRRMRAQLGLPPVEQRLGIAAHDFVTAAAAPHVVLSRARKDHAGTPTTPSRWLARLQALLRAAGCAAEAMAAPEWAGWAQRLDEPRRAGWPHPIRAPEPRPPRAARPRELWATDVEALMRNPYRIYARRILRLRELDPIDADPGAAERGQIIHDVLQAFVEQWPDELPAEPLAALVQTGRRLFAAREHRPQVMTIWWPRFVRVAEWLVQMEEERRRGLRRVLAELEGSLELEPRGGAFRIRARADRIEIGRDGALAIVDYKTGNLPAPGDVERGISPQMPIEGLIAAQGGFAGIPAQDPASLVYWQLRGGDPSGDERAAAGARADLAAILDQARQGLLRLIEHFDLPDTAYVAVPRPEIAAIHDAYEHLARVAEWRSGGG